MLRLAIPLLAAVLAIPTEGVAQQSVKSSDVKCRNQIGKSVRDLVAVGFALIDRCYGLNASKTPCDRVETLKGRIPIPPPTKGGTPAITAFGIATRFAAGVQGAWCSTQPAILANYPTVQREGAKIDLVGPEVTALLNQSAASLQGASLPEGRSARRCVRAIGHARTRVAEQVLASAIRCQRGLDHDATTFGAISPTCLGTVGNTGRFSQQVAAACAGFSGPDLGSCGPLPDCVIASATQTGNDLATVTYGTTSHCGDGKLDRGESCDDGPANSPTGACTDQCQNARCGDARVEAGVEECDPGSDASGNVVTDDPNCTAACQATRCGDGIVQAGRGEQCDDGNVDAGDGCSPTCQFELVSCPAGGTIDLTVTFDPTVRTFTSGPVTGFDVNLGYPSAVSFPGSQFLPVEDPSDPATRIVLLGTPYNLYDGTLVTLFDNDTSIRTVISAAAVTFSAGVPLPFERIRFDCAPGTGLSEAGFACTINQLVNKLGATIDPSQNPSCKVTLAR